MGRAGGGDHVVGRRQCTPRRTHRRLGDADWSPRVRQLLGLRGSSLTEADLKLLAARGITLDTAERNYLRHVESFEGGEIVNRNGRGKYDGIAFPYVRPGQNGICSWRIRRAHPEIENGKPKQKYMASPGDRNR